MPSPLPFLEAIASLLQRGLMPTNLGTAELGQLEQALRQRSFFSAHTLLEDYLQVAKDTIERILNPQPDDTGATQGFDPATARVHLKTTLDRLGYEPDPDKRGTIQDISSDQRIDLVVKTNTDIAHGFGRMAQGQDTAILDQWPAQELYRLESRMEERPWLSRWQLAGQATGRPLGDGWAVASGAMVALKDHPIWDRLGDPALFADGIGNPWPPFAFGSGMDVRDVSRSRAEELGIIAPGQPVTPRPLKFDLPEEVLS